MAVNGRVIVVSSEDARVVRAALCAGRAVGLVPSAGAAWLLPATLPPVGLRVSPSDRPACTQPQLDEVAAGHLSFAPDWLAAWRNETTDDSALASHELPSPPTYKIEPQSANVVCIQHHLIFLY